MLNTIRERRGTKLCTPAMFLVVPDHAAGSIIMLLIGRGTAECFHLLMLLCIRNTFRVIGQNVLVEGLVPGVVVGGGVVEFVEADCVAPAGDGAGGLVGLTGLVPGIFEGFVGGHGRQDCRCWLRVGRVGVAPPKHGFHASGQAHAAVVAQHLA